MFSCWALEASRNLLTIASEAGSLASARSGAEPEKMSKLIDKSIDRRNQTTLELLQSIRCSSPVRNRSPIERSFTGPPGRFAAPLLRIQRDTTAIRSYRNQTFKIGSKYRRVTLLQP